MSAEYEASVSIAQTGSKYMFGSFRWTQKDRTSCCHKHVDVALTGCLVIDFLAERGRIICEVAIKQDPMR